jgi:hypothetical protein
MLNIPWKPKYLYPRLLPTQYMMYPQIYFRRTNFLILLGLPCLSQLQQRQPLHRKAGCSACQTECYGLVLHSLHVRVRFLSLVLETDLSRNFPRSSTKILSYSLRKNSAQLIIQLTCFWFESGAEHWPT